MQLKRKVSISLVFNVFISKVLLVFLTFISLSYDVSHGSSLSSSSIESFLQKLQNLAPELHRVMSCFFKIFSFVVVVDSEVIHSLIPLIFLHVIYDAGSLFALLE